MQFKGHGREEMDKLLKRISDCQVCINHLPMGPRPVVQGHPSARILILSQAPGLRVHQTGIPWNDPSGDRLRLWLDLSRQEFYNPELVALLPMGFCYPGRAKSGDMPPRKECFELWHEPFVSHLKDLQVTLLVGHHAQISYLGKENKANSTAAIRAWEEYLPDYLPVPHPSPRNNMWLHKNPWFAEEVLPKIRTIIRSILQ